MPLSAITPEHYSSLLAHKVACVEGLLAPYTPPQPQIFASAPTAFRMRAEFRIWHSGEELDYVMFRREDPKTPVVIDRFPIACQQIQQLMPVLRDKLQGNETLRRKLFQIEFLSATTGDTLVTLIYHRKLDDSWQEEAGTLAAGLNISIIGRSRRQKITIGNNFVRECLTIRGATYHYRQYEQSFTQPNAAINVKMIEWACECAGQLQGDLLELYCGSGNFTLPLSQHFDSVVATELSKVAIRAARENLEENSIRNIQMIRLSAEEVTQAMAGEREFRRLAQLPRKLSDYDLNTVFVDPPRAGLDAQTVNMVAGFDNIVYISCNAQSLAANLASLHATHRIKRLALFDQFPYTEHIECGVMLQRR